VGLFSKKCPIEYLMSDEMRKRKDKCQLCNFWRDGKCHHGEDLAQVEKKSMRGFPALTKRGSMTRPKEIRKQIEQAALKQSGFNAKEQAEYWSVSQQYDALWEDQPEHHNDIIDFIEQWRWFMEQGLSPKEANEKVMEWLNAQRQTP